MRAAGRARLGYDADYKLLRVLWAVQEQDSAACTAPLGWRAPDACQMTLHSRTPHLYAPPPSFFPRTVSLLPKPDCVAGAPSGCDRSSPGRSKVPVVSCRVLSVYEHRGGARLGGQAARADKHQTAQLRP